MKKKDEKDPVSCTGKTGAKAEDMRKSDIRNEMRLRRKSLSAEERKLAADDICRKLLDDDTLLSTLDAATGRRAVIAVYIASQFEIDINAFISELLLRGICAVAPRWNGQAYELCELTGLSGCHLRPGPMNILEPVERRIVKPDTVDAWIIPGLAFTRDGIRLGYGGGWYDRLLSGARTDSLKTGVAHHFQLVDSIPAGIHDIGMDRIVTADI